MARALSAQSVASVWKGGAELTAHFLVWLAFLCFLSTFHFHACHARLFLCSYFSSTPGLRSTNPDGLSGLHDSHATSLPSGLVSVKGLGSSPGFRVQPYHRPWATADRGIRLGGGLRLRMAWWHFAAN